MYDVARPATGNALEETGQLPALFTGDRPSGVQSHQPDHQFGRQSGRLTGAGGLLAQPGCAIPFSADLALVAGQRRDLLVQR